jgi:hypothetical protein
MKIQGNMHLLVILWLLEEKICRKFLVLVAGKVGLDSLLSIESKAA